MESCSSVDAVSHTRLSLMVPVKIPGMCLNFERVVTRSGRRTTVAGGQAPASRAPADVNQRTPAPTRPPAAAPATVPTGPPVIR